MITEYYYKDLGDGMTMFKDAKAIVDGAQNVIDIDIFNAYLKNGLNGKVSTEYKNPYGQGRIVFTDKAYDYSQDTNKVETATVPSKKENKTDAAKTGDTQDLAALIMVIVAAGLATTIIVRRKSK